MKSVQLLSVIALAGLTAAEGQAIKDPGLMWGPLLGANAGDGWVPVPNPVRVSARTQMIASLEQSRVKIGEPLKLHFRFKNVSSEVIQMVGGGFDFDNWLIVTDASGTELPLSEKGQKWRQRPTSQTATTMYALLPGQDDGDGILDVTDLYRLDRPGNYFLRIARRLGTPPDVPRPKTPEEVQKTPLEEAVSDLIPFTITP